MIILTDEIAMVADRKQYIIGNPKNGGLGSRQYFTKPSVVARENKLHAIYVEHMDRDDEQPSAGPGKGAPSIGSRPEAISGRLFDLKFLSFDIVSALCSKTI